MNKNKFVVVLYNLVLLFALSSTAQKVKNKNFVFVSNDFYQVGSGKVIIKFFSDELKYEQGYNIYRKKEGESNFIKINRTPIVFLKSLPSQIKLVDDDKEFYEKLKSLKPETINKAGMAKAIVKLRAVLSTEFALAIGNAYIDSLATKGETYQYQVKRINKPNEILIANSTNIKVENWKQASEPQNIKFEKKKEGIKFSWLHQPDLFFGVDIYRKTDKNKNYTKLNDMPIYPQVKDDGTLPNYYFSDNRVSKDTVYQYKFNTVDYFGKISVSSADIKVGKKDFDAPLPADSLMIDIDTLKVKLTWKPSKSPDLMGYHIYRSKKYDKGYEKISSKIIPKSILKYTDIVPKVDEYFYVVASVDSSENDNLSSPKMADVRDVVAPQIPKNLKAVIEKDMIVLSWSPVPDTDLQGYFVYKAPAGVNDFVIMNGKAIKETTFSIKFSKNSKTKYIYKVLAIDSSFNRSKHSEPVTLQLPDVMPPTQPFIKSVELKNDLPNIIWMKNVDNDLKNYQLVRIKYAKDTSKIVLNSNISLKDTFFVDKTAEINESYKYILNATDSTGNVSMGSTPYIFKNVVLATLLKVKKLEAKLDKKAKNIPLTWLLEVDKNYYGCVLFRAFENEDMTQYTGKMISEISFTDKNIKKPGKYTYQLRIYDRVGNVTKSEIKSVDVPKME